MLDGFAEIPVCTGYRYRGELLKRFPAEARVLVEAKPEYRAMPGWRKQTVGILDYESLPVQARDYVAYLEGELEVPMALVSTGPRREETILRESPVLRRLTSDSLAKLRA